MNLAIFASGKGSNCRVIHEHIAAGKLSAKIAIIISNVANAPVLDFARTNNIPCRHLAREQFTEIGEFHDALLRVLSEAQTDLIVLAGYMKKIGAPILQKYYHRVLNIHPALLPAFGGKGMYGISVHRAVLDYGAKISGITVHLVDEEYDHGPIVLQKAIEIDEGETETSLASKIQALEHRYYVEAIRWFADGRVHINGRQVSIISH